MNDDPGAHQPETKAIMRWLEEMHFTASASLHGVNIQLLFHLIMHRIRMSVVYHS